MIASLNILAFETFFGFFNWLLSGIFYLLGWGIAIAVLIASVLAIFVGIIMLFCKYEGSHWGGIVLAIYLISPGMAGCYTYKWFCRNVEEYQDSEQEYDDIEERQGVAEADRHNGHWPVVFALIFTTLEVILVMAILILFIVFMPPLGYILLAFLGPMFMAFDQGWLV